MIRAILMGAFAACWSFEMADAGQAAPRAPEPQEKHFKNIQQLTFHGENAEAYFSGDGKELIYQSRHSQPPEGGKLPEPRCDQIFRMRIDGAGVKMVSTGKGRTTCSYFFPDGARIIYASTHLAGEECPPVPQVLGRRYVWPIYKSYDIFSAKPDGSDLARLTSTVGYDAEATLSPDGQKIIFTSVRDGDLELYTMNPDGSDQKRLTHAPGYDGGAFFSPDSKTICFRASRPKDEEELKRYRELLEQGLVEPGSLEIYIARADGSGIRQVTRNGAANFCPFFHPSGKKIIYASNRLDPRGRNFDLFLIDLDGQNEERLTYHEAFDGFPMFSPDGKKLVWCANRYGAYQGDTNVFMADWVE